MMFTLGKEIKSLILQFKLLLSKTNQFLLIREDSLSNLIFILLLVLGLSLGFHTSSFLDISSDSFGHHTISMMIPLIFSMAYLACSAYRRNIGPPKYLIAFLLFALLSIPLLPYLQNSISYQFQDDGWRYSAYAKNMIENHTLWGSDGLIREGRMEFIDQPGYRYWVLLSRLFFGLETRGMQLFHLAMYLGASITFLYTAQKVVDRTDLTKMTIFLSLTSPYVSKNILMGLSEWFTIFLFLIYIIFLLNDRSFLSIATLALIPFIRQNLLIGIFILMLITVLYFRKKSLIIPFLIILGLPLYHNLYYAQKFQYLAGHVSTYARSWEYYNGIIPRSLLAALFRSLEYLGYEGSTNIMGLLLAWLFVPLGTFMILRELYLRNAKHMVLPIMVLLSIVLPTLLFGFAYYPRFVYVNQTIVLICIFIFSSRQFISRFPSLMKY